MIDISIFIPSRKRPELLRKCIDSFFIKAEDASKIEMIILMDYDDSSYDEMLKYIRQTGFNIILAGRNRSQQLIRDYQNILARACSGHYCWGVNDECEVVQDKWDTIFKENIPDFYSDKIRYVHMDDDGKGPLCAFPALSRSAIHAINGYMPEEKLNWGADVVLFSVFDKINKLNLLEYNTIVDLKSVLKVTHFSSHNNKTQRDEVYYDIANYNMYYQQKLSDEDLIIKYINKILLYTNKNFHKHYHIHKTNIIKYRR